ncbi:MAG TPA: hypothetical protein VGM19_02785 [Armatimonadota bacterium]|jgi:hypothetical protein
MSNRWLPLTCILALVLTTLTLPTRAAAPSPARQAYEQAVTLTLVRGLGLTTEQMQALVEVLQETQAARQAAQQQAADLYVPAQVALEAARDAAIAGRAPTPDQAAAATAALNAYTQVQSGLQTAYENADRRWSTILGPAQDRMVETLTAAQQRKAAEALLGGAPSLADYFAGQMDLMRDLGAGDYHLLRYWESRRLAALLRPDTAPGYDNLANRVLDVMDTTYNTNDQVYTYQRPQLGTRIASYLGLPAAQQATYFQYDLVATMLASDQAIPLLQEIMGLPVSPAPLVVPEKVAAADALQTLAEQARVTRLTAALALTSGQLRAIQPLVTQAAGAISAASQAEEGRLGGRLTLLQEVRTQLRAGPALNADTQQGWNQLDAALDADRELAWGNAASLILGLREFLTTDQTNLVNWPVLLSGGAATRATQLQQLQGIAGQLQRGYSFMVLLRYQRQTLYPSIRIARTQELLDEYLPPGADRAAGQTFVLNLLSQMRNTRESFWDATWPNLITQLMVGLGAIPGPGAPLLLNRPLAWDDLVNAFTADSSPSLVAAMVVARGG